LKGIECDYRVTAIDGILLFADYDQGIFIVFTFNDKDGGHSNTEAFSGHAIVKMGNYVNFTRFTSIRICERKI